MQTDKGDRHGGGQRQVQTQSSHLGRTAERGGGADTARDVQTPQARGLSPPCAGSAGLERGAQRGGHQRDLEGDGATGVQVGTGMEGAWFDGDAVRACGRATAQADSRAAGCGRADCPPGSTDTGTDCPQGA